MKNVQNCRKLGHDRVPWSHQTSSSIDDVWILPSHSIIVFERLIKSEFIFRFENILSPHSSQLYCNLQLNEIVINFLMRCAMISSDFSFIFIRLCSSWCWWELFAIHNRHMQKFCIASRVSPCSLLRRIENGIFLQILQQCNWNAILQLKCKM